jgi:MFS family permease
MGGANGVFHMAAFRYLPIVDKIQAFTSKTVTLLHSFPIILVDSYIADSSVPRDRTWRLGIAEAFWQLGSPVGLFLGGYLYERGGYLCVFSTAVLFHLTAVLYTVLVLPEVPQPRQSQLTIGKYGSYGTVTEYIIPARVRCFSENEKVFRERDEENDAALATEPLLHPGYLTRIPTENNNTENEVEVGGTKVKDFLIGSLKAVVKKRPNHTRKCLLSLGFIMLLYGILNHGTNELFILMFQILIQFTFTKETH